MHLAYASLPLYDQAVAEIVHNVPLARPSLRDEVFCCQATLDGLVLFLVSHSSSINVCVP